jgi:hypothetical protein
MPMRQLRRCDFCGGDAAGVYEVLPPELDPTEAEQRRVVLCADCADTLETVVDPLLDRLGVDTGDGGAEADPDAGGTEADPDAADPRGASAPPAREPVDAGRDSGERSPAPATSGDAGVDAGAGADAEPVQWGGSGADDDRGRPASDPLRDGVSGAEPSGDDPTPTAAEPEPSGSIADDGAGVGDAAEGAEAADGDGADPAAGGAGSDGDGSTLGAEPAEFRTVMRLLGNREFPVERGSVVELAASAYDLDEAHVNRILDHAVDRGVIADDGGTLRRS